MKQITYEQDWMFVARAMVAYLNVEDGFWQLNLTTECVTLPIPTPVAGARAETLPGHIVRMTGVQLRQVPNLGFMCFEVKGGYVVPVPYPGEATDNGADRSESGPQEGGGAVGTHSGSITGGGPPPIVAGF